MSKKKCFPFYHRLQRLQSPACVSSRKGTARLLLLGAPGTSLWFGKGRPLICGLCGSGRQYCGLQTADGSLFLSKKKNSVDL